MNNPSHKVIINASSAASLLLRLEMPPVEVDLTADGNLAAYCQGLMYSADRRQLRAILDRSAAVRARLVEIENELAALQADPAEQQMMDRVLQRATVPAEPASTAHSSPGERPARAFNIRDALRRRPETFVGGQVRLIVTSSREDAVAIVASALRQVLGLSAISVSMIPAPGLSTRGGRATVPVIVIDINDNASCDKAAEELQRMKGNGIAYTFLLGSRHNIIEEYESDTSKAVGNKLKKALKAKTEQ